MHANVKNKLIPKFFTIYSYVQWQMGDKKTIFFAMKYNWMSTVNYFKANILKFIGRQRQ